VAAFTYEDTPVDVNVLDYVTDPSGLPLTLSLVDGPGNGDAVVDGAVIHYTPHTYFHGDESLTYKVDDGQGGSASAHVYFTVYPQNHARLLPPIDQANAEGDRLNEQLDNTLWLVTPDSKGQRVTFAAAGLPPGLSLDSATGVISGTIAYAAAETNGGAYPVTVTTTCGPESDTQTFTWYIQDTNVIPNLDDQISQENVPVHFSVGAIDSDVHYSWDVAGLPPGLSFTDNGFYAIISGTSPTGSAGNYTVTISATDPQGNTDQRTIQWTVVNQVDLRVFLAINGTLRADDDIISLTAAKGVAEIPSKVIVYNAPPPEGVKVDLSVSPAGKADIEPAYPDGFWIVPNQVSDQEDDVFIEARVNGLLVEKKAFTIMEVEFPQKIRAENTPQEMKPDRIPPRVVTPIKVTIKPPLDKHPVRDVIMGGSNANGTVKFKLGDREFSTLTSTKAKEFTLNLVGTQQTSPRNAGNLHYAIQDVLGQYKDIMSDGFSVAAIPESLEVKFNRKIQGEIPKKAPGSFAWGHLYDVIPHSDSKKQEDLDKVTFKEFLNQDTKNATGVVKALFEARKIVGEYNPANEKIGDSHAFSVEGKNRKDAAEELKTLIIQKNDGDGDIDQYHMFTDARTGVDEAHAVLLPNSGFTIHHKVEWPNLADPAYVHTTKKPKDNNGVKGGIMAAADQKQQDVAIE
jgi:hypothetical protein